MVAKKEPSVDLLTARRALDDLKGVTLLNDWRWDPSAARWVLHYRLTPGGFTDGPIPASTEWYVLVEHSYPWGSIKFFPAKDGGIIQTFPHQSYNRVGVDSVPWREGDICLTNNVRVLERHDFDDEPYEVPTRLRWHFARALTWLQSAAQNSLVLHGEPFELPQFPLGEPITVAFCENAETFSLWQRSEQKTGLVDLLGVNDGGRTFFTKRFRSLDGKEVLKSNWGTALSSQTQEPLTGIWLRLNKLPVLPPWQAPMTWQELQEACRFSGIELEDFLAKTSQFIRDGKKHIALLGFPIPKRVGEEAQCVHWQAMLLPVLSYGTKTAKGFRNNELGYWQRDRRDVLRSDLALTWLTSENWDNKQISTRGRVSSPQSLEPVLVIGAGSLGSALSELLLRAGFQKQTIMDKDLLEAGNLVRHTLLLSDLSRPKAKAVSERLNLASPHASVWAVTTSFPPDDKWELARIQECPIILDTTGSDDVIHQLEIFPWTKKRCFFSLSVGFGAKRLFCFASRGRSIAETRFRDLIKPWLAREIEEQAGQELPREGIGCWHPVFPARVDDIGMLAAAGVKFIESALATPLPEPQLVVFEQCYENGIFVGIRRVTTQP